MDIGGNIEIVDHYEWYPGCREANLKIRMENGDLRVTIVYDGPQGANERVLNFSLVCSFTMETVSAQPLPCEHDGSVPQGAVVEYPDSEDAIAWSKHLGGWRLVRHYSIALLSENLLLAVLAGGFSRAD